MTNHAKTTIADEANYVRAGSGSSSPWPPRIVAVTPVRDEEQFIGPMIESIVNQKIRPERWIIVSDGSTDNTNEIVAHYARRFAFIQLVQLPARAERRPGGEGAIASILRDLDLSNCDYVARFDADLLFDDDYFARILDRFNREPRLGIAGGGLYIRKDGDLELERSPTYHVRGALKMYRRECFKQIGGIGTQIGWDTADEVYAWSKGWRTASVPDVRVIHERPTGAGFGQERIYAERGKAEYATWSLPGFVVLKALKLSLRAPRYGYAFLKGFLSGYSECQSRPQDPNFRKTRRRQQLTRMLSAFSPNHSR